MKTTGIFIPGRLSSERLPNKLILPIGKTCLWDMACEKLNDLPNNIKKYVLCYDKPLIDIAQKYNNIEIIIRDKSTTEVDGPLTYIFKELQDLPETHLMFLNPCLSFLKKDTISKSLQRFNENEFDFATSVKQYKNWVWTSEKQSIIPIDYKSLSTKSIPIHYEAAHCFHIFSKDHFFSTGNMLEKNLDLIEVSEDELLDVDTIYDYNYVKWAHENNV